MTEPAKILHQLLAQRWSPRAFDPEHEVADATLFRLLEAARWAPSAANTQPWRFLVARRGTGAFDRLLAVLAPGNQVWAGRASVLLLVAAETVDPDGRRRSHAGYDTGQAVAHLTVQAQAEGLDVHQMGGFDAPAAAAAFDLPPALSPVVVVALGRRTHPSTLPEPLAARETAPRTRRPVRELLLPAGDLPPALPLSA